MFADKTGMTFLDYNAILPLFGNLFFALSKMKTLFNEPARADGWFFRGMGSSITLNH